MKSWIALALALLALPGLAPAQTQRVLLDTDRGPIVVELDTVRAPRTSANFLAYVDAGRYDDTILHRVLKDFVIQGGGSRENTAPIARFPDIASERGNGLFNTTGTLAMALSNTPAGIPDTTSADSEFFINMGNNASLDPNYTVFGKVTYGFATLASINTITVNPFQNHLPLRPPVLKRAVRTDGFPILDLHTGAWYDPTKTGRGFSVEVGSTEAGAPRILVYWYDYFEGRQVWMGGVVPFQWGASSVTIPMLITQGGQFGPAFNPASVVTDTAWGQLTVRFTGCDRATFTYTSKFGNGTVDLRRLTMPTGTRCTGN